MKLKEPLKIPYDAQDKWEEDNKELIAQKAKEARIAEALRRSQVVLMDSLCHDMENAMEVPHGTLKSDNTDQYSTLGRDLVIKEAFFHRVPMIRIAAYFGKTRQGIHKALNRVERVDKLHSFFKSNPFNEQLPDAKLRDGGIETDTTK